MRTGVPEGHRGHFHEAAFYDSDDEFLTFAIPFLHEGTRAGEPTLVSLGAATTELVRQAVGEPAGVTFLDRRGRHSRPASVIQSSRESLTDHVANGAHQVRILGETPHPGHGVTWDGWARYEAVMNHVFADLPLWNLCPYDMRITPERVVDDAARTHPRIATTDGAHLINPRYQNPADFMARRPPGDADPLEVMSPTVELVDPAPAAARQATREAAAAGLPPDLIVLDDFVLAVSEAVSNALLHGRPPVRFRLWTAPDRVVATVSDHGAGPTDPFAGLLPGTDAHAGGTGLWLAHQLCSHVGSERTADGYTVRLVSTSDGPPTGRVGNARDDA